MDSVKLAYSIVIGWMLVAMAVSLAVALAPEAKQAKRIRVWYIVLCTPIVVGLGWMMWTSFGPGR